jgi:hypothetical protein
MSVNAARLGACATFHGVIMGLRPTKVDEDAENQNHRSLTLAARKEAGIAP